MDLCFSYRSSFCDRLFDSSDVVANLVGYISSLSPVISRKVVQPVANFPSRLFATIGREQHTQADTDS